jgi:hypothetical protein
VNNHNAYINMSGGHLSPQTEIAPNPDLLSLSYQAGPLGNYYLPPNATALLGAGSRTAGSAGLYHFTSLVSNTKEAAGQVNIGPAYLALVNGNPVDSNGDGVPDFIADRNGDGNEDADEAPWTTLNTPGLAMLSSFGSTPVSGIIQIRVNLGTRAPTSLWIDPVVDDDPPLESISVANPAQSVALIQIDTRRLKDGTHTLLVRGTDSQPTDTGLVRRPQTAPATITTANGIGYPAWETIAEQNIFLKMTTSPSSANTLWFFDASYSKSYSPAPVNHVGVTSAADGTIDYNDTLSTVGFRSDNTAIYSVTEATAGGGGGAASAVANPATTQASPTTPETGNKPWVVAYTDDGVDDAYFWEKLGGNWVGGELLNTAVSHPIVDNPWPAYTGQRWLHDGQLGGWLLRGQSDASDVKFTPSSGGMSAQTWPMRTFALAAC